MPLRSHEFIETYDGLVGFGLDRKTDEHTLAYFLQAFSDDGLLQVLIPRMSDAELDSLFSMLSALLKKHLDEAEYHELFLKQPDSDGENGESNP